MFKCVHCVGLPDSGGTLSGKQFHEDGAAAANARFARRL